MKKLLLILCFFNAAGILFAQGLEGEINTVPPNPESLSRTQSYSATVNEHRGIPQVSIPLYQLNEGDLNFGLTLKYVKAGVKLTDVPSEVGMSWILESGGIINRVIRGMADEKAVKRLYYDSVETVLGLNIEDGTEAAKELNQAVTQTQYVDLQPDIFNFIYPGGSGSFYLDQYFVPVLIAADKTITIDYNKASHSFCITDDKGIKYYYGGSAATEETGTRYDSGSRGITSYFLTKVEDTKGYAVNYHYSRKSEPIIYISSVMQDRLMHIDDAHSGCRQFGITPGQMQTKKKIFYIYDAVILDSISTAISTIKFDRTTSYPSVTKVTDISFYQSNNLISKTSLRYITQQFSLNEERFFLNNIETIAFSDPKTEIGTTVGIYELIYEDPLKLPKRLDNAMDFLGYFNGVHNADLLPNTDYFNNTLRVYNNFGVLAASIKGNADRRPNFEFAKKGTLKSIAYPTGGKVLYEYEGIPTRQRMYFTDQRLIRVDRTEKTAQLEFDGKTVDSTSVIVRFAYGTDYNGLDKAKYQVKITDIEDGSVFSIANYTFTENGPFTKTAAIDLPLTKSKKYLFTVTILNDKPCFECFAVLSIGTFPVGWEVVNGASLRVKKKYEITQDGSIPMIERYFYDKISNINTLPSYADFKPRFVAEQILTKNFDQFSCCLQQSPNP
ncbi:MAG: hypothetical protein EAS48_09235, partial [Chryseobacterium sp.]